MVRSHAALACRTLRRDHVLQVRPQIETCSEARSERFYLGVAVGSAIFFELLLLLFALLSLLFLFVELPLDLGHNVGRLRGSERRGRGKKSDENQGRTSWWGNACSWCWSCCVRLIKSVCTLTEVSGWGWVIIHSDGELTINNKLLHAERIIDDMKRQNNYQINATKMLQRMGIIRKCIAFTGKKM